MLLEDFQSLQLSHGVSVAVQTGKTAVSLPPTWPGVGGGLCALQAGSHQVLYGQHPRLASRLGQA